MKPLPPGAAQAIEWYARLASGAADEQAQHQFQAWLAADVQHAHAWQTLQQQLNRTLAPLAQQEGVVQALRGAGVGRRRLLRGALSVGGMALGGQLLTVRGGPLHARLGADLRTATAERRSFTLEDGSTLLLNAQSAVDVDFGPGQRRVQVLRGAVQAQISRAPGRPFVLACAFGEAWLDGGRCLLALQHRQAQLWSLDTTLQLRSPGHTQTLTAGQGLAYDGHAWQPIAAQHTDERRWPHGLLEVHDQSLGSVIDHLRPYHHGILQVSTAAAALRISGVFTLQDSKGALAALGEVLPLRMATYLSVWTRIDLA